MIDQKDVVIGGDTFKITQFGATQALGIEVKLMKLLGPAFLELQKAGQENEEAAISAAINILLSGFDKVDVVSLVKELVSRVTKGTVAINFDMEFAGKTGVLIELITEVVKFNFADVFSKLGLSIGQ